MIKFKTLKELTEYAVDTSATGIDGQVNTITVFIEQGWVRMSPKVRSKLLADTEKMTEYVTKLIEKYTVLPDNLINLFEKKLQTNTNTIYWNKIKEKNLKKKQKISDDRIKNR